MLPRACGLSAALGPLAIYHILALSVLASADASVNNGTSTHHTDANRTLMTTMGPHTRPHKGANDDFNKCVQDSKKVCAPPPPVENCARQSLVTSGRGHGASARLGVPSADSMAACHRRTQVDVLFVIDASRTVLEKHGGRTKLAQSLEFVTK